MPRRVFYSFYFEEDVFRVSQVRQMGKIEGNKPVSDNDWEKIKSGKDVAIKKWIKSQMKGKSCTVVLVGRNTAGRKWINHEIIESWNSGMGVVGIRVHGLKNIRGNISSKGENPFDYMEFEDGTKLSSIVKCYNPQGTNSKARYAWINKFLAAAVEEAITIRKNN